MYIPKRYGESKTNKCPFCERDAFFQNSQKIPTCKDHKNKTLDNLKCMCGSWLDMREGKYGVFFTCINCGALNIKKVLEMNSIQESTLPYKIQRKKSVNETTEKRVETKEENRKEEEHITEKSTSTIKPRPKTLQEIEQEMRKGKEQVVRSDELDFF